MNPIWYIRAAVLAAILGGVWWFSHARYTAGEAAGRAHVQAAWDAEAKAQRDAYASAKAKAQAKQEADRKAAEEVERDLRNKLAQSDAAGRDTARRLRDYQARACRGPVPTAAASPGEPAGAGGESERDAAIGRATEDTFAACKRDAERLNGWERWASSVGL